MERFPRVSRKNAARALARRAWRAASFRADVHFDQLSRRIGVLESLAGVPDQVARVQPHILATLSPSWHPDLQLARIGSEFDGGYVLPMKMVERASGVLSIGVGDNNEADFDLAQRGLAVHAWDHTVNGVPREHELITFHSIGVGPRSSGNIKTLAELTELSFGREASDLLLLMDAEGAEWEVLQTCPDRTLDRFIVLSVEFHGLGDALIPGSKVLDVLGRLRERFTPIAVHANNHGTAWQREDFLLPDIVEVTYVRVDRIPDSAAGENDFNMQFRPCCPDLSDLELKWTRQIRE